MTTDTARAAGEGMTMNALDELERLNTGRTAGEWRTAEHVGLPEAIVSQNDPRMSLLGLKDGQAIVFEKADAKAIVAAINALGPLLKVARAVEAYIDSDDEDRAKEFDAMIAADRELCALNAKKRLPHSAAPVRAELEAGEAGGVIALAS